MIIKTAGNMRRMKRYWYTDMISMVLSVLIACATIPELSEHSKIEIGQKRPTKNKVKKPSKIPEPPKPKHRRRVPAPIIP